MNKRIKQALILLVIVLIAMFAISQAYSKYFSTITGTGTATVAKWSFKVNGKSDNLGEIVLGNTAEENSKVAEGKIAPGTSGHFAVELDVTGTEVAVNYEIVFKNLQGTMPENLKFYETKAEDGTYSDEVTDLAKAGVTGTIELADEKVQTVDFYWVWEYETPSGDEADRLDGEAARTITFDVVVTGTQAPKA